jgi:hypothetical protein
MDPCCRYRRLSRIPGSRDRPQRPLPAAVNVYNTAMKSITKVEATTRIELVYTVLQTVA